MSEKIGIFVAWPYANGDLHLGHVAGAYLPADIFARFNRLCGNSVMMVSGSDAHGTPITLKARDEACNPMDVVSRYHQRFLDNWKNLGISFDLFTHTHTKNHIGITQDFFNKLLQNGDLAIQEHEQFFDETAQMFLADRYVRGVCPRCSYQRARGDQCENCGATFNAVELKEPESLLTGARPEIRTTSHYFFNLSKYQDALSAHLKDKSYWRGPVLTFTQSMIRDGLKPRPITRDLDWGVPVPVEGWDAKVMYVWFDAVIGYYSASLEWSQMLGQPALWESWWKDKSAKTYYFIGKDNVPFHTVVWPIELMGYDSSLNLPYDVPANQFLNIDGEKFSTSRGLAVWLGDVIERFDADAVRYYLTTIAPETKDANFSWDEFLRRNNGELVAAWGNLVNRVLGFAYTRFDGKVPHPGELDARDDELMRKVEQGLSEVGRRLSAVELRDGLKEAMSIARDVNKYLDDKAPWTLIKTDKEAAGTAIFVAMRAIDSLKIMLAPFLPFSTQKLHEMLGYSKPLFGDQEILDRKEDGGESYKVLSYKPQADEVSGVSRWLLSDLQPGTAFEKPSPLYRLLDEEEVGDDK